jgi:hypothetical protein
MWECGIHEMEFHGNSNGSERDDILPAESDGSRKARRRKFEQRVGPHGDQKEGEQKHPPEFTARKRINKVRDREQA